MVDPPATSPMKIMEAPHPKWGDMANRLGPASQALAARRFFSSSAEEGQHRRRTTRLMRALAAHHSFRRRRAAPPQHRRAWKIGRGAPLRKKRSTSTPPRGLKVERGERASALSRKNAGRGGPPPPSCVCRGPLALLGTWLTLLPHPPMKIMGAPHQKWGDMANRLGPASQALAARRFFSSSAEEGQHRRRTTRLMRALAAHHSFRRRRAAPPQHRRAWKIGRGAPLRKNVQPPPHLGA